MHVAAQLSQHAQQRRHERNVPPSVLHELLITARSFVGNDRNGRRIHLRVRLTRKLDLSNTRATMAICGGAARKMGLPT